MNGRMTYVQRRLTLIHPLCLTLTPPSINLSTVKILEAKTSNINHQLGEMYLLKGPLFLLKHCSDTLRHEILNFSKMGWLELFAYS